MKKVPFRNYIFLAIFLLISAIIVILIMHFFKISKKDLEHVNWNNIGWLYD